jgi:hypothetical protein
VHSSISSSEPNTSLAPRPVETAHFYAVWSIRALVSLALFCIAIEALTRFGFSHVSRIEARIARDHRAALAIRKSNQPTVLLLGNSLMLEGLDVDRLHASLAGQAQVVSFPIEGTQYLDWYYGLRRLFDEGSQPDLVIFCMSAEHLISSGIRGDYSAYYLFRLADIPQIRRDIHYDLTKTSSLVFSRFSLFYAGRIPLRNFILVRTDRRYADLLRSFIERPAHFPPEREIERIAQDRLATLRTLCSSHGARFAFLLAPGFGPGEAALVTAGIESQTEVLIPIHLNQLGRDEFRDGFHLKAAGARIFTDKVSEMLRSRLVKAQ